MRVLYCTDTYPPQVNGVSVVTSLSVHGLIQRGWECTVIAPHYPTGISNPFMSAQHATGAGGETVVSIPSVPLPSYPDIRLAAPNYTGIRLAIKKFQPDLIHAATEFMIGRLGQLAASKAGIPVVTSYHTDFGKYIRAYGLPALHYPVSRYLARFHKRAARTYTPSEPAKAELERIGVKNVEVWGRGVDLEVFHPKHRHADYREMLGVSKDAFLWTHVGRLAKEKSVGVILKAFAMARNLSPNRAAYLVIAGTGPCETELRAIAPEGTIFLGHLDRRLALPQLYAASDGFLFSSTTETLGLVILEAMASGVPVVAVPAGGVADHLRNGVNGLAYPPHNPAAMAKKMILLMTDEQLRQRLMQGARATAEQLSWELELDRLDASYREVLETASTPG